MHTSILVVDDDTAILRGVQILLEQSGYTVILATSGQQAIEILSTPPWPTLVVLDILLPIYDGFEVCRHIRHLPTHIPILMVSAR
jgi:DNA-binding response OmpR family regulator